MWLLQIFIFGIKRRSLRTPALDAPSRKPHSENNELSRLIVVQDSDIKTCSNEVGPYSPFVSRNGCQSRGWAAQTDVVMDKAAAEKARSSRPWLPFWARPSSREKQG